MEFKFSVNEVFRQPIVKVGCNLVPPGFTGDRRAFWDAVAKVSEVVNAMGESSAAAQGLSKPITTAERLRNSEHFIYLLVDQNAANGRGAVTGMLKTGKKGLYVFDRNGQHYQVSPPCVLDFYIHESRQRTGLGKKLFEHMLQDERIEPVKMAIDRPSDKFLGFLNKHYSLNSPVKQMNNYVVFDGFFPSSPERNGAVELDHSISTPGKKQSANGLQTTNYASPLGRYGAPRPPCSMGQIIHNQTSTIPKNTEPTGDEGLRWGLDTNYQYAPGNSPQYPNTTQSAPNMYSRSRFKLDGLGPKSSEMSSRQQTPQPKYYTDANTNNCENQQNYESYPNYGSQQNSAYTNSSQNRGFNGEPLTDIAQNWPPQTMQQLDNARVQNQQFNPMYGVQYGQAAPMQVTQDLPQYPTIPGTNLTPVSALREEDNPTQAQKICPNRTSPTMIPTSLLPGSGDQHYVNQPEEKNIENNQKATFSCYNQQTPEQAQTTVAQNSTEYNTSQVPEFHSKTHTLQYGGHPNVPCPTNVNQNMVNSSAGMHAHNSDIQQTVDVVQNMTDPNTKQQNTSVMNTNTNMQQSIPNTHYPTGVQSMLNTSATANYNLQMPKANPPVISELHQANITPHQHTFVKSEVNEPDMALPNQVPSANMNVHNQLQPQVNMAPSVQPRSQSTNQTQSRVNLVSANQIGTPLPNQLQSQIDMTPSNQVRTQSSNQVNVASSNQIRLQPHAFNDANVIPPHQPSLITSTHQTLSQPGMISSNPVARNIQNMPQQSPNHVQFQVNGASSNQTQSQPLNQPHSQVNIPSSNQTRSQLPNQLQSQINMTSSNYTQSQPPVYNHANIISQHQPPLATHQTLSQPGMINSNPAARNIQNMPQQTNSQPGISKSVNEHYQNSPKVRNVNTIQSMPPANMVYQPLIQQSEHVKGQLNVNNNWVNQSQPVYGAQGDVGVVDETNALDYGYPPQVSHPLKQVLTSNMISVNGR